MDDLMTNISATSLYLLCSGDSPQLFGSMTISQNEAFIAQGAFVRTSYLHRHVWMIGVVAAKLNVIRTKMQLFSIANDALVVATILFVPVSQSNPDTIFGWDFVSGIGEIYELAVSLLECFGVTRILVLDSVEIM